MLVECYRCQDFDLRVHAFSRLLPLSLTPLCRESREVQGALLSCKTASGDDVDVCSERPAFTGYITRGSLGLWPLAV